MVAGGESYRLALTAWAGLERGLGQGSGSVRMRTTIAIGHTVSFTFVTSKSCETDIVARIIFPVHHFIQLVRTRRRESRFAIKQFTNDDDTMSPL
jgi:hypothetical protein